MVWVLSSGASNVDWPLSSRSIQAWNGTKIKRRAPAIVDDLRDFCEPQAATQGIVIRTHYDEDLPPVLLDVDLFKQALLNLILNAEHALPDGGELILTTRREGPWCVLEVTDTGCGMTEEVRSRVFDAFR